MKVYVSSCKKYFFNLSQIVAVSPSFTGYKDQFVIQFAYSAAVCSVPKRIADEIIDLLSEGGSK